VENDFNAAAKLQQANLRQISVDGKRACDFFGESQDLHVPVAIARIPDYDTCRLIKDQYYVSCSWTRYVAYYKHKYS